MIASDCSFQEMRDLASAKLPNLGVLISFIQVEEGIKDLESHWYGFVDTSDDLGNCYNNKTQICSEFGKQLREQIEAQFFFRQVGYSVD